MGSRSRRSRTASRRQGRRAIAGRCTGSTRGPSISYMEGPRTIFGHVFPHRGERHAGEAQLAARPDPVGHDGRRARRRRLRAAAPAAGPRRRGHGRRLPRAAARPDGPVLPGGLRRPAPVRAGLLRVALPAGRPWPARRPSPAGSVSAASAGCAGWRSDHDLVVSTYPLGCQATGALRQSGRLAIPAVGFLTDLDVHGLWLHEGNDHHFTVWQGSADEAVARSGVPSSAVGPVLPDHPCTPEDREDGRALLGVTAADTVVLVVAGSWGVGDVTGTARAIRDAGAGVPVVLCGTNEATAQAARRRARRGRDRLDRPGAAAARRRGRRRAQRRWAVLPRGVRGRGARDRLRLPAGARAPQLAGHAGGRGGRRRAVRGRADRARSAGWRAPRREPRWPPARRRCSSPTRPTGCSTSSGCSGEPAARGRAPRSRGPDLRRRTGRAEHPAVPRRPGPVRRAGDLLPAGRRCASATPTMAQPLVDAGHEVAVHSWDHRNHLRCRPRAATSWPTRSTSSSSRPACGRRWFRPPYGALTPAGRAGGPEAGAAAGPVDRLGQGLAAARDPRVRARPGPGRRGRRRHRSCCTTPTAPASPAPGGRPSAPFPS